MQRIEAKEIRERLETLWPTMKNNIMLYDKHYHYFTDKEEALQIVRKHRRHLDIAYQDYVADCDKKALWLNADIKEYCVNEGMKYTYAFGMASGLIWKGELRNHTACLFMTEEKIYLLDSSFNNDTWEADSQQDLMIEVRI